MKTYRHYFLFLFSMAVPVLAGPPVLLATCQNLGISSLCYRSLARRYRKGDGDNNDIGIGVVKSPTKECSAGPSSPPKTMSGFALIDGRYLPPASTVCHLLTTTNSGPGSVSRFLLFCSLLL